MSIFRKFTDQFKSVGEKAKEPTVFKLDLSPMSLAMWMRKDLTGADAARLNRYYTNWAHYLGRHWEAQGSQDGVTRIVHNYVRAFANKINRFLNANGFIVVMPDKYDLIAQQLNKLWKINDVQKLTETVGLNGTLTGDMWVRVNFENKDGKKNITFTPFDASIVFPSFNFNLGITKIEIRHPVPDTQGGYNATEFISEIHSVTDPENKIRFYKNSLTQDPNAEIKEWAYVNPIFPHFLIQHGANYEIANNFWGLDDIQDLIPLNKERNEIASSMREIIDYQEAPITVVKGAKMVNIDKGSRKVWSGLPYQSDVFNLTMNTDLAATQAYLDLTLMTMHDVSGVPAQSLGKLQNISNTSGIALHYQNLPLMEVREAKAKTYGVFYKNLSIICLRLMKWMDVLAMPIDDKFFEDEHTIPTVSKEDAPQEPNPLQEMDIQFPSPLPKDEMLLINQIQALFEMELISEEEAYRMLNYSAEEIQRIKDELKNNPPIRNGGYAPMNGFQSRNGNNLNLGGVNRGKADSKEPKAGASANV